MNPSTIALPLTIIGALALVALAVLSFLMFHKVRQIHLATFALAESNAAIRRETETLFSQVQSLLTLERKLGLAEALPPLRGWAGSPDFLLAVAEETLANQPRLVVECSSGSSTVVIARCLQINGRGKVMSLEHDPAYAEKTRALLARHHLQDWAIVVDAPLQTKLTATPWYAEDGLPAGAEIDLLVVDGPPASTAPMARFPALPRLQDRMSDRAVVMLDDADRPDEIAIVQQWMGTFPEWKLTRQTAEKGLAVLRKQARPTA